MTIIEGGLRDRLIRDALIRRTRTILDAMGWLVPSDRRLDVRLLPRPTSENEEIRPNRVSVTVEDVPSFGAELGSTLAEYTHMVYWDVYAENDAVGSDIAGDLRAGLEGKLAAAGMTWPTLDIYAPGDDPDVADPLFVCSIENVIKERVPRESPRPWERHWFAVRAEIVEEH